MKLRFILPFLLFTGRLLAQSNAPLVVSQLISNDTASSAWLQAQINPNTTNTALDTKTWFRWDTSPTALANVTSNTTLSATNVNVFQHYQLVSLTASTRYYYQAVASNAVGITYGTVENFATTQVSYNYTPGHGLNDIDPLRPYGSEPGSVWDDAMRQVKAFLVDFLSVLFNPDGSLQNDAIQTANLQDGSVTASKLSADALAAISSNGITGLTITNALMYETSAEYTNSTASSITNLYVTIASLNLQSNTFRKAMAAAEINLNNATGANRTYYFRLAVVDPNAGGGLPVAAAGISGPWLVQANRNMSVTASWIFPASATNAVGVLLQVKTDATKSTSALSSIQALVNTFRLWDIP